MQADNVVARFGLSPCEEIQFRLNLENESYASVLFDEATAAALRECSPHDRAVKKLLSRDAKEPFSPKEGSAFLGAPYASAMAALAVAAGLDPNQRGGISPLAHAVQSGSDNLVSLVLRLGADPNQVPERHSEHHPLGVAIARGLHSAVELLIRHGADLGQKVHNTTALGVAARAGDCQLIGRFLDLGADPNTIHQTDSYAFETPLEIAIRRQDRSVVELLLQRGADPNLYDDKPLMSGHPLCLALSREDLSFARLLLLHGADWRVCKAKQVARLPFKGFEWFVRCSGYAPNVPAPEGRSLLEIVSRKRNPAKAALLVLD